MSDPDEPDFPSEEGAAAMGCLIWLIILYIIGYSIYRLFNHG